MSNGFRNAVFGSGSGAGGSRLAASADVFRVPPSPSRRRSAPPPERDGEGPVLSESLTAPPSREEIASGAG